MRRSRQAASQHENVSRALNRLPQFAASSQGRKTRHLTSFRPGDEPIRTWPAPTHPADKPTPTPALLAARLLIASQPDSCPATNPAASFRALLTDHLGPQANRAERPFGPLRSERPTDPSLTAPLDCPCRRHRPQTTRHAYPSQSTPTQATRLPIALRPARQPYASPAPPTRATDLPRPHRSPALATILSRRVQPRPADVPGQPELAHAARHTRPCRPLPPPADVPIRLVFPPFRPGLPDTPCLGWPPSFPATGQTNPSRSRATPRHEHCRSSAPDDPNPAVPLHATNPPAPRRRPVPSPLQPEQPERRPCSAPGQPSSRPTTRPTTPSRPLCTGHPLPSHPSARQSAPMLSSSTQSPFNALPTPHHRTAPSHLYSLSCLPMRFPLDQCPSRVLPVPLCLKDAPSLKNRYPSSF